MRNRWAAVAMACLWAGSGFAMGINNDSERKLDELPRVMLREALNLRGKSVERIVFLDGKRDWFAIQDPGRALRTEIGFYGTRMLEAFFGGGHLAAGCQAGDTQKILYAVAEDRIQKTLQFCFASRMDFGALHAFAAPAVMFDEALSMARIDEVSAQIEADPDLHWVNAPAPNGPYTHIISFTDLYLWRRADMRSIWEAGTAIEDDIAAFYPEKSPRIDVNVQTRRTYTLQDPVQTDVWRTLYEDAATGETRALPPDIELYTLDITLRCDLADCTEMLDYFPWAALAPWRARDVFNAARSASDPVSPPDGEKIEIPRQKDVLFDTMTVTQPELLTYPAKWTGPRTTGRR